MKKPWGRWVWLAAGAVVIVLIFYNLSRSPEWRNFRWDHLWHSIVGARLDYLLLSLLLAYASFLVRAIRWRFFMAPIKAASLWVLFVGQILGFSAIFLVGRPGELVRPAYIAKKENVSMSGMIAVWLLERVFDTIAMVVLFAAAIYFEPVNPATARWSLRPARDAQVGARALRIYRSADSGLGPFPPEGRGHERRRA